MWKNKYCRADRPQYGACALHAGYLSHTKYNYLSQSHQFFYCQNTFKAATCFGSI